MGYGFMWRSTNPLAMQENNFQGPLSFPELEWNYLTDAIKYIKDLETSLYYSDEDLEQQRKLGKKFLDHEYTESFVKELLAEVKKNWKFFASLRDQDFAAMDNKTLYSWIKKVDLAWQRIYTYHRGSQEAWLNAMYNELLTALKQHVDEDEAQSIIATLSTPAELDEMKKEELDMIKLCLANAELSDELGEQHNKNYPWLFVNHFTREDIRATIQKRFNEFKKKGDAWLSERQAEIKNHLTQLKKDQEAIYERFHDEKIEFYGTTLATFALNRILEKTVWCGQDYCAVDLFVEVARRSDVDVHTLTTYYREVEMGELLLDNKKLSVDEIEQRKRVQVLWLTDGEVRYYSGEEAEEVAKKQLGSLLTPEDAEFTGLIANPGKATGTARILLINDLENEAKVRKEFKKGDVLVLGMVQLGMTDIVSKAGALVTDESGIISHAAVLAREFGIPCIVGTGIGTRVLKDGDTVLVDARKGKVKKL